MIPAEKRARLAQLRREIADLTSPEKETRRRAAREARQARQKAIGKPTKGQRQPRVRDNAYLAFLRRRPCIRCGATPCDAAHVRMADREAGWRYVGKGEKPDDARAVSLCRACHTLQHSGSEAKFWADMGKHAPTVCAELYREFMGASR